MDQELPEPTAPTQTANVPAIVRSWKHGWAVFPIALFFGTRACLALASGMGLRLVTKLFHDVPYAPFVGSPTLAGFCRWDCGWYDLIARQGYEEYVHTNFWPLYPLLTRAVSGLTRLPVELSLLVVSNGACLAAYCVIYRVFMRQAGVEAARWGLTLFCAYPFSFFHAAGYPESLMLLASASAILLALRGRHVWAGVALGLGVLARHVTILSGGALLVAQLRERGTRPKAFLGNPAVLGLGLPFLFAGGYLAFCHLRFGDALSFWKARELGWGPGAWWGAWEVFTSQRQEPILYMYLFLSLVPGVGAAALLLRRELYELAAFAAVFMGVLWTTGALGLGRYSASCWPAFLPLGMWAARHHMFGLPLVVGMAVLQGLFFYLWSHQFWII